MTPPILRVEEDGTRVYTNYMRYKPKAPEDRKIGVNKPDDPRAVRVGPRWFIPLEFLPDGERDMPETIPDEETLEHKASCRCRVCSRPQASEVWRRARNRGYFEGTN